LRPSVTTPPAGRLLTIDGLGWTIAAAVFTIAGLGWTNAGVVFTIDAVAFTIDAIVVTTAALGSTTAAIGPRRGQDVEASASRSLVSSPSHYLVVNLPIRDTTSSKICGRSTYTPGSRLRTPVGARRLSSRLEG